MSISPASNVMATAVSGLKRAENELGNAAQNIAEGSLDPKDIVKLSQTSNDFKANTSVIRTEKEMNRSLLDIVA